MPRYSFEDCLRSSYQVNWRIEDVLGTRRFDPAKRWLPASLSATGAPIACLDETERRKLTHVEMASYAHLFGYVEEFIAPKMASLSLDYEVDDRTAFDALANFVAEEVKHMNMFRQLRDRVNGQLGFEVELLGGAQDTAKFVLSKSTGSVLLLTACIEWFTQRHYLDAIRDDDGLDAFTKDVFKAHWLEESQHAKIDHLETIRAFDGISNEDRDRAIDDLIELVGAVDGLLQIQSDHDVANLARYLGRKFTDEERAQIREQVLRSKRWTFIVSGVTHPRFEELFVEVTTPEQRERVGAALGPILASLEPATA